MNIVLSTLLSDLILFAEAIIWIGLTICLAALIILRIQDWIESLPGSWVRQKDNLDQR